MNKQKLLFWVPAVLILLPAYLAAQSEPTIITVPTTTIPNITPHSTPTVPTLTLCPKGYKATFERGKRFVCISPKTPPAHTISLCPPGSKASHSKWGSYNGCTPYCIPGSTTSSDSTTSTTGNSTAPSPTSGTPSTPTPTTATSSGSGSTDSSPPNSTRSTISTTTTSTSTHSGPGTCAKKDGKVTMTYQNGRTMPAVNFCEGTKVSIQVSCDVDKKSVLEEVVQCKNGEFCNYGACVPGTTTCKKNDDDGTVTVTSSTEVEAIFQNKCVNETTLTQYSCSSDKEEKSVIQCGEGNICVTPIPVEPSGMFDLSVNGPGFCEPKKSISCSKKGNKVTILDRKVSFIKSSFDSCADTKTMSQVYCSTDNLSIQNTTVPCELGKICKNGACQLPPCSSVP